MAQDVQEADNWNVGWEKLLDHQSLTVQTKGNIKQK
jgi:hypothetical protein